MTSTLRLPCTCKQHTMGHVMSCHVMLYLLAVRLPCICLSHSRAYQDDSASKHEHQVCQVHRTCHHDHQLLVSRAMASSQSGSLQQSHPSCCVVCLTSKDLHLHTAPVDAAAIVNGAECYIDRDDESCVEQVNLHSQKLDEGHVIPGMTPSQVHQHAQLRVCWAML